ncbi:MAG: hypothetical protein ACK5FT_00350 [Sphingomonadales bacterium]|jgi:hypothetical protein
MVFSKAVLLCGTLIIILLCACAPKVVLRDNWGGGGLALSSEKQFRGLMEKNTGLCFDYSQENVGQLFSEPHFSLRLPVTDSSKKIKKYNILNGRYPVVDTLPPDSSMNDADRMLKAARKQFYRAEKARFNRKSKGIVMLSILIISLACFLLIYGSELSILLFYPFLFVLMMVFVLAGIFLLLGLLFGLVISQDTIRKQKGIRKILRAPKKAPADRWLEYEIRMLLMLNNFMNPQEQIRRIQRIREKSQSDLYNPWLSKLKELKYYNLSLVKQRRLPAKIIIVSVFISPYLLLLLASLIIDLFNL